MVKDLPAMWETRVQFLSWKIPWRSEWKHTLVFLPWKSHRQRSLVGYRPRGCKESDTTEWLTRSLSQYKRGFPGGSVVKNLPANAGDTDSIPESGRFLGRRKWKPTPVFFPGEYHGQRSLVGYSPRGCKESNVTELLSYWAHTHNIKDTVVHIW